MADSDEEGYFALGTPFEELEEDAPRKKPVPIHEQIVTDDRGRRRFHGAFTGGFSAGYFNTVDTKEGWTPKTFVSSRSQKATERATQRPEDFMDEEDLSEFGIAPKRVVTTQKFLPSERDDSNRKPCSSGGGLGSAVLGEKLLQDLIVPVKMSVGVKLLTQMGWKEGQGVGPRVRREAKKTYGCAGPPETGKPEEEEDVFAIGLFFAPKDVESIEFTSKDDLHGIGYSGINPKTALLSQRDWLGMDTGANNIGIRGQGFGVGALEEDDDDVYGQDNLSNYDIELSTSKSQRKQDLHGWTGPQKSSGQGGMLSIFCKASKPPPARKHYPPPVVPRDFKPVHKIEETSKDKQPSSGQGVKEGNKVDKENHSGKRLTSKERGEALGEVPLPTPKKSIFDYIAEEDKTRLKETMEKKNASNERKKQLENDLSRRFTSASRGPLSSSGFKPFAMDAEKQARYERYLSGKSDTHMPSQQDRKMTEWERECELEEFARSAALYRPLSQTMAARFTTAKDPDEKSDLEDKGYETKDQSSAAKLKMFGALTRERFEWHPDKILCKRFNIPHPYPGSGVTGVLRSRREKVKNDELVTREVKAIEYNPQSSTENQTKSSTQQVETEITLKPSALLAGFQSLVSQKKQLPTSQDTGASSGEPEKEEQKNDEQKSEVDENVIKRAPMDLFNEIFAESSSESDSESEENEETKQSKTVEMDIKDNVERHEENEKDIHQLPANDIPMPVPENDAPVETVEREPSPETFGPALPSSFGDGSSMTTTTKEFQSSTREDSLRRQEKQKSRKKKKRKNKGSDSDISGGDGGYSRRRKDKKNKKTKKRENDLSDSDEEYKNKRRKKKTRTKTTDTELTDSEEEYDRRKKSKKKTREKDTDSDLTDNETEGSRREKKKKTSWKYSDGDEKYSKSKRSKKKKNNVSDDSSNNEHTKHKKNKRKEKERKKYSENLSKTKISDRQKYGECEQEEYVEKVVRKVSNETTSRTLDTTLGSTCSGSKSVSYHEKEKDFRKEISSTDIGYVNDDRTADKTGAKELEISRVPNSKEIINKLKNIQMLKERKRMRAADFM